MFDLNHDGEISVEELKAIFADNIINSSSGDEMVKLIME
jgi:Ca2+-binding EF-hand superfamily protein